MNSPYNDFSLRHVGSWKAGQYPKCNEGNVAVLYDQRFNAYDINQNNATQMGAFVDWVVMHWELDNCPRDDKESAEEYLDRIGVTILCL